MSSILNITTLYGQQAIHASTTAPPRRLSALLAENGLALNTRCGKNGLCRGCTVTLVSGELLNTLSKNTIEAPTELLACLAEWSQTADVSVTIPSRSLLAHEPTVADDFQIKVPIGNAPLFAGDFGLAIDIGTTTAVVMLAELDTGKILARASGFNQQIQLGDDVLARIQLCCTDPEMVTRLQESICRDTLLPLAREACAEAGVALKQVGGIAIAGNSTMLHLLFGIDPSPMGIAPFTPRFLEHQVQHANTVGLCELPSIPLHTLPGLAAYVGADIAAGIFATGLHYETQPTLFVDVGTNGEIVLVNGEHLVACATAAGPAFEGSGLSCGMRATDGAIEGVTLTKDTLGIITAGVTTIGNTPLPQSYGICGSAYIDILAQARTSGVLMESGRFDPDVVATNPDLFRDTESGRALLLCGDENPTYITEPDVALLLQAKAAIAAGIQTLLNREGLTAADVEKVYIAGGFGMYLDIPHSIACGLLPGFTPEQVETVGNTSLGGAYLAMLDRTVIDELDRIRARAEIVELNLDPGFEDRYIDNLSLPLAGNGVIS